MDMYSTTGRDKDPRDSLYVQDAYSGDKFEISSSGKIVPKKKFHQSLYDPEEQMYESNLRGVKDMSYGQMKESLNVSMSKKNKLRFSEYRRGDMITPKANIRKTIDFGVENEHYSHRTPKHLNYSHGGKRLNIEMDEHEMHSQKPKYDPRVYYGEQGGLKMKKMQFEREHEGRGRQNLHERRKFDTNISRYSGKHIDLYSAHFSPSKYYNKAMSYGRKKKDYRKPSHVANTIIPAYEEEFHFDMQSDTNTQNSDLQPMYTDAPIKDLLISKSRHHKPSYPRGFRTGTGTGSSEQSSFHQNNYRRHLKNEYGHRHRGMQSKPLSIDKKDRLKALHDEEMSMNNFGKSRHLRPTLKDLKQKYTDNDLGSYSINIVPG
jgi:hypothetical protein